MFLATGLADLVRVTHLAILVYIVVTPFVAARILPLLLYIMFLVVIVAHWIANHHFCILSLVESKLRGIDYEDGFINAILKPVFGFGVSHRAAYAVVGGLFLVALCRMVGVSRARVERKRPGQNYVPV